MSGKPINILGASYTDEALALAHQESINWIPEKVEVDGARNASVMKSAPGLQQFSDTGGGAIRASLTMSDVLYVVSGEGLYSIDIAGAPTYLGFVPTSAHVCMSENGYQLVIVNGIDGFVYDNRTSVFSQITSPNFYPTESCDFIDQYIIFVRKGTGQFFWCAIADATTYDALDFSTAEANTDLLIAIKIIHREIWLFGERSIEIWVDSGDANSPFTRSSALIEKGIASVACASKLDNTLFWLSNDGYVYRGYGYNPLRISTHAIEQGISEEVLSDAISFAYEDTGHGYFILTFVTGKTWCYDVSSSLWHRRKSYGMTRWRANNYIRVYDKHFVGDYAKGIVWELRRDLFSEGTDPLVSERITQYFHANENYIYPSELEITLNTGDVDQNGQGSDPMFEMRYSDDGGRNWTNWKQRSLGKIGQYNKRIRFHGLGRFRSRLFHFRISDPVRRDLIAASAIV